MLEWRSLWLGTLLVLVPTSLAAQSETEFAVSGFGGLFVPASDLFDDVVDVPDLGLVNLQFGHKAGFNAGGRFAVWPNPRFGVEAEAAFVLSDMEGELLVDPGTGLVKVPIPENLQDAHVFMASLNALYAFIRPPLEPLAIYVSGGVGIVSRGGDFFEVFESTTDVAGVVGLGLKYAVASGIWLRGDVKDYISSFNAEDEGFPGSTLQNDILINVGLELTFTRR